MDALFEGSDESRNKGRVADAQEHGRRVVGETVPHAAPCALLPGARRAQLLRRGIFDQDFV